MYERCIIYTAWGKDGDSILRVLGRQNTAIDVKTWEKVNFVKDAGQGDSSIMVLVPRRQWEIIDGLNRKLKYGLGRANCVLLRRETAPRKAPVVPGASPSTSSGTSSAEETRVVEERRRRTAAGAARAQGKPPGAKKEPQVKERNVETVTLSSSPEK